MIDNSKNRSRTTNSERRTRQTSERRRARAWQWGEGRVNKKQDHFELHHGKAFGDLIPVAIVGRVRKCLVKVQFLIDRADPRNSKIVEDTEKELKFYLAELNEQDP